MLIEIRRGLAKQLTRTVLKPVYLVGSADDCDMVLGDQQFAPIHFYLFTQDGRTIIRSVGKQPELTVNGKSPHASSTISDGDRIRTGPFEFLVKAA